MSSIHGKTLFAGVKNEIQPGGSTTSDWLVGPQPPLAYILSFRPFGPEVAGLVPRTRHLSPSMDTAGFLSARPLPRRVELGYATFFCFVAATEAVRAASRSLVLGASLRTGTLGAVPLAFAATSRRGCSLRKVSV